MWSGLGINYGHVDTDYSATSIDTDLNYLWDMGFRKIRVALPNYNASASYHTKQRDIVSRCLAKGFYTIYGCSAPSAFTDVQWAAFKAYVKEDLAVWAESLNNANLELSLGNEEELHNTGENAPNDATVRSDVRTLATETQLIYTVGPLGYQASASANFADWISEGKGDIDMMGFNIYDTLGNLSSNITSIVDTFGDAGQITEWNVSGGYSATPDEFANEKFIRDAIKIMDDLGLFAGYFFTFNHSTGAWGIANWGSANNYNIQKEDRIDYRLAWQTLVGKRRWFIN